MTTIVTRVGKGSPLTTAEVDANFTNLNTDKAELASPAFTGTPTVPTAVVDDNSAKIASTNWIMNQVATTAALAAGVASSGVSYRFARADHVHPIDTTRAPLASPTFTGTVTIPAGASIAGYAPIASPTFTGTVTIPAGANIGGYALLASPTFSGTPASTTPAANDNTTRIATTAWFYGQAPIANPSMNGAANGGISPRWAREDHIHPSDTSRAPTANPVFSGIMVVNGPACVTPVGLAFATAINFDCTLSNIFYVNPITTNIGSLSTTGQRNGQTLNIRFSQDGAGGHAINYDHNVFHIAGAPSTIAGTISWMNMTWTGGIWEGSWTQIP